MNYIGDKTKYENTGLREPDLVQCSVCSNYGLMSDMVSTCLQTYHKTYFKYYCMDEKCLDEIGKE